MKAVEQRRYLERVLCAPMYPLRCSPSASVPESRMSIRRTLYLCIVMIFLGHFSAHRPQFVHLSASICARKLFTVLAPASQFFSQRRQPIQPTSQTDMSAFPFSLELHCTNVCCLYGISSIRCFGHAATHFPQAFQASLSTTAMPSTTWIASNGHAFTQEP